MGYYFRYPRKQKSKEKIKREQLIAADKKIISFTKLENLGTKELYNQKKYYEDELDEIKNNMSIKNYEKQINELKKIENKINKEIKKLAENTYNYDLNIIILQTWIQPRSATDLFEPQKT